MYDCVIVGGRCAGAPLARFLARAGKRVVIVDAAALPKDQPLSTHFIHPFGMRILDELGLGDRVRAVAPPVHSFQSSVGDHVVRLRFPAGEGGCCPRRLDLDAILLEGAREAGAEVRTRCRVVGVLRDGERVAGVVVEEGGERRELRAALVVGADGRNSTIAELVGAEEYNAYEGPRVAYWAYWPRPPWYADDLRFAGGTMLRFDGTDARFVFPVNRDQLIIGFAFPNTPARTTAFKADLETNLVAKLRENPWFAPLVEQAPISRVIGIVKAKFFFRRAVGPGWALVGDAGLFKDPTPGLGISDALRDARALARAVIAGSDAELARYWRERDVASLPLFYFARDMGELSYDNPFNRLFYERLGKEPTANLRMLDILERRVSPYEAFRVRTVLRWTFGALLRGRFDVLGPFFKAGRVGAQVAKQVKQARRETQRLLASPEA
jgi:flavin-dependent dehydrogenase